MMYKNYTSEKLDGMRRKQIEEMCARENSANAAMEKKKGSLIGAFFGVFIHLGRLLFFRHAHRQGI